MRGKNVNQTNWFIKKSFPNILPVIMVFLIGSIFLFYTLWYGDPAALAKYKYDSLMLGKFQEQQSIVNTVTNETGRQIQLSAIFFFHLDSNLTNIISTARSVDHAEKNLKPNSDLPLKRYFDKNWNGQCLFAFIEYYDMDLRNNIRPYYYLVTNNEIYDSKIKIK